MDLKGAKIGETFLTKQKGDATLYSVSDGKYKFITEVSKICFECNEHGRSKSGTGAYDIIGVIRVLDNETVNIISEEEFLNFNGYEYFNSPEFESFNESGSKYLRKVPLIDGMIDTYAPCVAFDVKCPARQHAIKKLLAAGLRGKGDCLQDLREARDAVTRAIQLEEFRQLEDS